MRLESLFFRRLTFPPRRFSTSCSYRCPSISNPPNPVPSMRRLISVSLPPLRKQHHPRTQRSEEHTSELQSRLHLVCRPLLEKKIHSRRQLVRLSFLPLFWWPMGSADRA